MRDLVRISTFLLGISLQFTIQAQAEETHQPLKMSPLHSALAQQIFMVPGTNGLSIETKILRPIYESSNHQLIWQHWRPEDRSALLQYVQNISQIGLIPSGYAESIQNLIDPHHTAITDMDRDFMLTAGLYRLLYALDHGVVNPQKIGIQSHYQFSPQHSDEIVQNQLLKLATEPNPMAYLSSLEDQHPIYQKLRKTLQQFTRTDGPIIPLIAGGKSLKKGMIDDRVIVLRQRLGLLPTDLQQPHAQELLEFDDSVDQAVKQFQTLQGLHPDGVVGSGTLALLNMNDQDRYDALMASLEQWRWLPKNLGDRYIIVNIPSFDLMMFEKDETVLRMKVVVGQPTRQTPLLNAEIESIVLNPYWSVPPKVAKADYLPKLQENPSQLRESGYKIYAEDGTEVEPELVDWSMFDRHFFPFRLRQDPGSDNGLGHIKFNMPNSQAIYLHDTPKRALFDKDLRAFSSGCIRLQHPFELATAVLGPTSKWDLPKIQHTIETRHDVHIPLVQKLPVYIVYMTAWVDGDDNIKYAHDIYGRSQKITSALERAQEDKSRVAYRSNR